MSAVSFAVFFYIPFKHQGLKARKPLRIAVREPTLVGARLPPCALPHLTESGRAGAWRGLSDTCKWKWDPTWKQTRQSLGAGRRGNQRKTLPFFAWSSVSPSSRCIPGSGIPQARSRSQAHAAAKWGSPREARNTS